VSRRFWSGGGLALIVAALFAFAAPVQAAPGDHPKLDKVLNKRANSGGTSRVIVVFKSEWDRPEAKTFGGKLGRQLNLIGAQVLELPNGQLKRLAGHPGVLSIHHDRPIGGSASRVAISSGARSVQQFLGYTGAGVGVAVVDSGVTAWHDDLTYNRNNAAVMMSNGQRVAAFVDFVNGRSAPYDDNGHGTHVSGIIAGNGYDSWGIRAGIAPESHLVSLKVLDVNGRGVISNAIAALEYVVANRHAYNIRVVNLSIGAAVTESFKTDPLALAAKRAVDAGIVVVTAAGNIGKNALGQPLYGGITSPGNAPWVLTVGAASHQGTLARFDDTVAAYSSRGPTAVDFTAKPDLVAPGTGIISLSDPNSLFYTTKAEYLVRGIIDPGYKPYLSLTGTSMAAPVVAGTVALMVQANPNLTPNLVKAVLQYTAEAKRNTSALMQGAGFLNARAAVDMAKFFATAQAGARYPGRGNWSKQIIWGNYRISGGVLSSSANAFGLGVVWGAERAEDGDNIVWGTRCGTEDCDNIVWGTMLDDGFNIVWGTMLDDGFNIVWGTMEDAAFNIVWGTSEDFDNVVWGTDCGGEDCDSIVWGTSTVDEFGFNIVWGTSEDADNIVWGTSEDADNIVWGTNCEGEDCDNMVWGTADSDAALFEDPEAPPTEIQVQEFELLFEPVIEYTAEGVTLVAPVETGTVTPPVESPTPGTTTTGTISGGL
jgi:serine protease AprX